MKIASIGSLPPDWGGPVSGGVASYHAAMVQALSDFCPQISRITVIPNKLVVPDPPLPARCHMLPLKARDRTPECVADIAAEYDAVIIHHIVNLWAGTFVDAGLGRRVVGVVHSWTNLLADPARRERHQHLLDACGALVFPSHHARQQGADLGLSLPEGAGLVYGPLAGAFLQPPGPADRSGILFAGTLNELKRCGLLIAALALLPDHVTLTVAGDGPLRADLQGQAAQLGLAGRVRFAGDLDRAALRAAYRSHSLLCVPSRSESLGLVYVEALAQGAPVIGYAPSIDELSGAIGQRCGLGFAGDSADALAALLQQGLAQGWDRDALSAATIARFGPEESARAMMRAIGRLQPG